MTKIFLVVWLILGTVFMGTAVLIALILPSLASDVMSVILPAVIGGAVTAIPFSYVIAKKISSI